MNEEKVVDVVGRRWVPRISQLVCGWGKFLHRTRCARRVKEPPFITEAAHVLKSVSHIVSQIALLALDQKTWMVGRQNSLRSAQHCEFVTFRVTFDKSCWPITIP